ncbi:MAG: immunoglobulin domain-containing protein, partial [Phycisphaerales bacterium]|nr:immunoglobulin domain-containing protein [Phycisphaerales bacterium]
MTLALPRWLSVLVSTLALFAALGVPAQQAHAQFCAATITSGNQTVCVGDPVTITASITNPGGATIRWFRGATQVQTGGTSYSIASATTADAGSYTVTLTGGAFGCNVTSAAASLTVRTQVAVTNQPDSINRATGSNASFTVAASGTSPTFQWRRNGVNLVNGVNANGTTVSGATTATLTLTSIALADAGNYTVVVDNACNTVTSAAAVLSVFDPVVILAQPVDVNACPDETAAFSVSVGGSATGRTFQWRKAGVNLVNGVQANGTVVSGATTATLSLAGVKESDQADYTCFITNIVSSATTAAATLNVYNPPTIIGNPAAQSVCPADTVNYSVLVISSPAPTTYQWQRNGVNLVNGVNANGTTVSGATTSTLTLTSVASGDAGTYRCVVRNGCPSENQTISAGAALTVGTGVTTTNPVSTTVCELFGSANFSVTVTGTPAPTIQWRRNGVNLVDGAAFGSTFSGVNTTTLTITSVDPAAAGNYDAVVANPCDTDISLAATLTVRNQIIITTSPASQTICEFGNASFNVAATGAGPISYQWQRNSVNLVNGVNAAGTTISGATTPILTLTGADPDDDGTYRCVVSNDCDTDTSLSATLTVRPQVIITSSPADQTVCTGNTVNFTVTATGAGPLTYQWRRNGVNLANGVNANGTTVSGVTTAALSLTSVDTGDAGDYTCAVTNAAACDTDISAAGTLVVNQANLLITLQPIATTVCEGNNAAFTIAATGGGLTYQWRRNGVNLVNGVNANGTTVSGATTPNLSLSSVDPADEGTYSCVVANNCDTDFSLGVALTVNPDTRFTTTPPDRVVCPGANTSFLVQVSGTAPFTFQWRRNGVNLVNGVNANGTTVSGATTSLLSLSSVAAADAGAYDCVVSGACSTANSIDADLVVASGVTINTQPSSATVCQGTNRVFTISVSGTPTPVVQWQRNGVNIANGPTGNGSTFSGVTTTSLTISNVQPGDAASYRALVSILNTSGTTCDAEFTSAATLNVDPLPAVTSISAPTTVCPGANVSRTVLTTGATAFQWRRNGVNLINGPQAGGGSYAGVNTSTLSIVGITNALAGDYTCVVSNLCGPVISPMSTVTVRDTVSILASPSDQTITEGGSASFTVSAAGTGPLTFQWQRNNINIANGVSPNGTLIAGATTATLNLSNVSALDAGNFRCVVTNTCGSTNSLSALLTVNPVSPACSVADIVGIGGTPPPDGLLTGDDFNAFIAAFAANTALADITGIGG